MSADVRIRWHLELVGDVASPLLKQDRAIRSSMTQTDRAQKTLAKSIEQGGRATDRASVTATAARRRESRATEEVQRDVQRLNRAQAEALGVGGRLAASASRVASAYRRQATAAREASAADRARASAARASSRIATGAAGAGAGLTRGTQAAIGAAAGGGIVAKTVATFAGFEQQMSRVAAVSGATQKQMGALTAQAEDLGAKTNFSAREAADGMYQLATAGFKTQDVMRAIPGTLDLAAASGTDLASAAELQASALRGFGLQAKDAGRVADVLAVTVNRSAVEMDDLQDSLKYIAPVARATGQSMDQMLAAIGLMGNVGVKGSQAGTTLRTALVRLTAPTMKSSNALLDLGIKAESLRGPKGLLPLPQILERITRGAQGVDKGTRNAALAAIFGREALSGMVAMVDAGPAALERNIKALKASDGVARRTAQTMRHNVAGAWDNFTGSLETAAITLTQRFSPALQGALTGGAHGINALASGLSDAIGGAAAGAGGRQAPSRVTRGAARTEGRGNVADVAGPSRMAQIGQKVGAVARTIGTAAMDAGRQLLEAFKPAEPFFRNVLLPLLEGIGKGVLISVVGAFKVLVPVIRIVSTALGAIGKVAAPLAPVFRGLGTVIGFVLAGPILKGVALLGRLGGVFRLVGGAARLLGAPLNLVGRALGSLVGGVGRAAGAFGGLPARLGSSAASAGRAVLDRLGNVVTGLPRLAGRAVGGAVRELGRLATRVPEVAGSLASAFVELGKKIVRSIIDGIKAAPGAIKDAVLGLIPEGARDKIASVLKWTPAGLTVRGGAALLRKVGGRRGGRMGYQGGGLVEAAVSPGELITHGGDAWIVPGAPVAADSVRTVLPVGAAVWTGDGQARLAAGEAPASVLQTQAPHFQRGGRVHAGRYDSTAYGPPWTGANGTGVTATGINLRPARRSYGLAVDPRQIPLGSAVYAWPNPFGYTGRFRAFDTGSAIKGNRLDFYDWRGRQSQMRWGHKATTVSTRPVHTRAGGSTYTAAGGAASAPEVRILGRNPLRGGLVEDALSQGVQAGQAGLTRGAIRREGNPILAALREQLGALDRGSNQLSQKYRRSSSGDGAIPDRMRSLAANLRVPYRLGGGHGGFSRRPGALDCSGYVSNVLHYSGANPELRAPVATGGLAGYGVAGRGRRVTIHVRNGGPAGGHTMLTIDGRGYSSGNRATGRLSGRNDVGASYLATLPIKRHPRGLRTGGIAGAGARLSAAASRAANFRGHSLEALDTALGAAVDDRVFALRRALLAAVHRGGPQRIVARLQAMLSEVDFEVGRRIGHALDVVAGRSGAVTRGQGVQDRYLRGAGLDPTSSTGIAAAAFRAGAVDIPALRSNVGTLQGALTRARRTGNREQIRAATDALNQAQDDLAEATTTQVERQRDLIRALAQETVDRAGHVLELVQGRLTQIDTGQRLAGLAAGSPLAGAIGGALNGLGLAGAAGADTPEGMRQRSAAIMGGLLPALQGQRGALEGQLAAAQRTGDLAGVRSAELALQSNANDLASAVGDAAQLLRDASVRAAQDVVDQATSTSTLAGTGLQRLELEQRLAGTYEAGGAQRAAYITGTVVPALQGELAALADQERTYREQGMAAELRQTIEAEAAKRNEILQASLDAQEAIADNTEPRNFGGTLGFGYGGETLTDSLVTIGNGV